MEVKIKVVEALTFDMDGVVVDSEILWKQAELEVFSSTGVDVTDENCILTSAMTTTEVTKFCLINFPGSISRWLKLRRY